jgi:phytoene synthase
MKNYDKYCADVTKKNSSTFYNAFRLLKNEQKYAIYAVYAFCRRLDDIIDAKTDEKIKIEQMNQMNNYLDLVSQNKYQGDQLDLISLQEKFQMYKIRKSDFELMIKGQLQDLTKNRYMTLTETEEYCYLVASSVGLMINPILTDNKEDEKLEEAAKYIGYGLQLTNILRDIGEDAIKHNRIYIPADIMNKYNVTEENFKNGEITDNFIQMYESLAKITESYYQKGNELLHIYPFIVRKILKQMNKKYFSIIQQVRDNNYDVFSKFLKYGDGIDN